MRAYTVMRERVAQIMSSLNSGKKARLDQVNRPADFDSEELEG